MGDHPRSRGVYHPVYWCMRPSGGSSPLARGLLTESAHLQAPGRIIPARAGFTEKWIRVSRCQRDHPRSRGVYPRNNTWHNFRRGSSPLARGLPARVRPVSRTSRIIPARAGFTGRDGEPVHAHGDHPRSRGVYVEVTCKVGDNKGSSPLARGLRRAARRAPPRAEDHPRSRGVYLAIALVALTGCGSSPLARGLPHDGPLAGGGGRIIPARAGFTDTPD